MGKISCKECQHWSIFQYTIRDNERGMCMISKLRHPQMSSGCGLITTSDFWCKIFLPKKEQQLPKDK